MDAEIRSELELELEPDHPVSSPHAHAFDPISVAFGAIFAILGAVFLFGNIDASTLSMAWAWAALFGAIGLLLFAVGLRRHVRTTHESLQAPDNKGPREP